MQNSYTPVYNRERTPDDHIETAIRHRNFAFRQRSPGELFGRLVMMWFGIVYLAALAITLEGMHRAPELDCSD
jgi:hypothetical protein